MPDSRVRILAVDDDPAFLQDLADLMRAEYDVRCVRSAAEALAAVREETFHAVLLDLDLGRGTDGFGVLDELQRLHPDLPVIMVTRDTSAASAVTALKRGAVDYLDKRPDLDDLERRISRALSEQRLARENRFLRRELETITGEMIGEAPVMRELREIVRQAAGGVSPVLITGETGTGKELVARSLHHLSCPEGLFVPLNCAAIPGDLFEAELFGSERGAYTGSERRIQGAFETACGGLLFLDEITEIEPALQAKLLRAVEQREFRGLGGGRVQAFTGRIVASTNREPLEAIREGRLRQDLYYRLSAYRIEVPPLRRRREDIPRLAEYFVTRKSLELKRPRPSLMPDELARLCADEWPGNVRELSNAMERFVVAGAWTRVGGGSSSLPAPIGSDDLLALSYDEAKRTALKRFQEYYVESVLAAHSGSVNVAAEKMGLSRFGLQKLLARLRGEGDIMDEGRGKEQAGGRTGDRGETRGSGEPGGS